MLAVTACDIDYVTNGDIPQEAEMRVAVRRIDRDAALARIGRLISTWPGPKASACPLLPASTMALAPMRLTSMRATGQVSAHDQGFIVVAR